MQYLVHIKLQTLKSNIMASHSFFFSSLLSVFCLIFLMIVFFQMVSFLENARCSSSVFPIVMWLSKSQID
jgi:hypothetical protein